jgi:Sulfotransferase family
MLVSHPKKFIYLKTTKTGGTSVEIFLEPYCRPAESGEPQHHQDAIVSHVGIVGYRGKQPKGQIWWNHMPGTRVRELVGERIWAEYYKFCIVRNPFDRMVSQWWMTLPAELRPQASADMGFARERFSKWVEEGRGLTIDRNVYLIDGKPCTDRILRHENLKAELAGLCKYLGLDLDVAKLGSYKSGFRARKEHYTDYYTDKARQIVEHVFRYELDHFDYAFEEKSGRDRFDQSNRGGDPICSLRAQI